MKIKLRMYGTQEAIIKTPKPQKVISENKNLKIVSENYDNTKGVLHLSISGRDMQGETGLIQLIYN
jgi:hypothetical protein